MTDPTIAELAKYVGVAAPLVFVLFTLLRFSIEDRRQCSEERTAITDRYIDFQRDLLVQNTQMTTEAVAALTAMRETLRDMQRTAAEESRSVLDAIGRVGRP